MRTRIALVSALLLASCAGPRPPVPESASVTAPPAWRESGGPSLPIRADWWEGFGDPILSSLVVDALDHNVDLLLAAARIDEAGAQFRLVASQSKLSIGLGAQGGHDRSLNAFGVGFDETDGKALVTASYELDLFGRLAASTKAAKSDLLATRAARDTLRLAIAAEVIQGYIGLRSLDEKLAIAQDTLATRDQERRLIQHRVAAGYSPALEAQQAEAEYQVAAQLVPEIQLAITRQENALNLLAGNSPGSIRRGKPLSDLGSAPIPSALPAEVLRQRPDIAEAEDRIAAADHQLDAARAAFMPRIQLVASGGLIDSTVLANPVSLFSLGGSILAPLFEGGALRAQEAATASRRDQAAFAYRKAALTAFAEVEDAMAGNQRLSQQETAAQHQRDALDAAFLLAGNRYRAGYAPYLERLDAERSLLGARLAVVEVRASRLQIIVSLYQSLGGGWSQADQVPLR